MKGIMITKTKTPKPLHELYEKLARLYGAQGFFAMRDRMEAFAKEQKRLTWN